MEKIAIEIIKALLIGNLIVNFQPIQWILELLPKGLIKWTLIVLTSCFKCATTWTSLIITGDLYIAAGSHLVAEGIQKINQKLWERKDKTKLII